MTAGIVVLLVLAGLSEAAGRVLPLVAGRSGATRAGTVGLLFTGTVVDGTVFALWPFLAGLAAGAALDWTPTLLAPLLLSAVLAFPLLGPALHGLLLVGVGAGLAGVLAGSAGIGWWTAAGWVAVTGIVLAAAVDGIRRLVVRLHRRPAVLA
ncbi:hypothetical protein M1L60_44975 [Actinoplanes sp. TRM 88003]|uniref:Integral membrane protein n=1 Tax=Paractinoplanes aksuensis TaxID=2939490 RepID=A0ABT1E7G1_9ACTN|nr:hypothetical protein [Actinoplanes aksuensis]MCO8277751.1 hypothetical protein [Actinoplanes aksuensis]